MSGSDSAESFRPDQGLEIDKNAIRVNSRMRTNIEGVYAAGDIVTYDGKLKLISIGYSGVAVAVNSAKHYIDPKAKVSLGRSTAWHEMVRAKIAGEKKRTEEDKKE